MLRASIYDPGRGTTESIEEQLLLHYGNDTHQDQLKQIGVAQGLSELANSVDGHPVSWIKTSLDLQLLIQVEPSNRENWRNGIWIYATVALDEFPQFVLYSLRDAYYRFRLLVGSFEYCQRTSTPFKEYWTDFFANWTPQYRLGALAGPRYLRLCSGVISPDTINEIEHIKTENGFTDILVCSATDYAFYWPGKYLDLGTRADLQNLLESMDTTQTTTQTTTHDSPDLADAEIDPTDPDSSWGIDISSYIPSIALSSAPLSSATSIFSRQSLPSMPSMPSMQSINSLVPSIPTLESFKKPFESIGTYFQSPEKLSLPISRVVHTLKIMIEDKPHWLVTYQRHCFVFCFISPREFSVGRPLEHSCSLLARDLEGMSFAADPPNQFEYMVLDSQSKTITSTLTGPTTPEQMQLHQLITRILGGTDPDRKVLRTSSNWWVHHHSIDLVSQGIFCKKSLDADMPQLTGSHAATDEWITSFQRRRGSRAL